MKHLVVVDHSDKALSISDARTVLDIQVSWTVYSANQFISETTELALLFLFVWQDSYTSVQRTVAASCVNRSSFCFRSNLRTGGAGVCVCVIGIKIKAA